MGLCQSNDRKQANKVIKDITGKVNITNDELSTMAKMFQKHARGDIANRAEFKAVVKALKKKYKDHALFGKIPAGPLSDMLFDAMDVDRSGTIDLQEFLLGMNAVTTGTPEQKARWSFQLIDKDNSGSLDQDELIEASLMQIRAAALLIPALVEADARAAGIKGGKQLEEVKAAGKLASDMVLQAAPGVAQQAAQYIMELGDINGDGQIDIDEWITVQTAPEVARIMSGQIPKTSPATPSVSAVSTAPVPAKKADSSSEASDDDSSADSSEDESSDASSDDSSSDSS